MRSLRIAFIHPDLGIGGAERLVVDAALGLQKLGHNVDIYTSHHDPQHCFQETRDGTLKVHHFVPPFPRSWKGKFHILFAHLRQLHLAVKLILSKTPTYDVYFVDQLPTCIFLLRTVELTPVVFYCHFPDKLLANGAFVEGTSVKKNMSFLKKLYRIPMDLFEEYSTRDANIILVNSKFTARIFKSYFPHITQTPRVVYPGINVSEYEGAVDTLDSDTVAVTSSRPTLLSLNRFEGKKNALLALEAFGLLKANHSNLGHLRLVLAGGYDPRLQDNVHTLRQLINRVESLSLTYAVTSPGPLPSDLNSSESEPDVLFVLNFSTSQRTALLLSPDTLALLYTPANEHFGIVPVEAMACGIPVLACDSGGPTESIVDASIFREGTGWLKCPDPQVWANTLLEIIQLSSLERAEMSQRAKARARSLFSMEAMARGLDEALQEAADIKRLHVFGWGNNTTTLIILGFIVAYLAGPFLFPVGGS